MSVPNSCCLQAVQDHKDSRLSDELLIRHLFSRLPEVKIDIDDPIFRTYQSVDDHIQYLNPFCFFVRCFIDQVMIQGTIRAPFEHVFAVYRGGTVEELQTAVHAIEDMDSVPRRVLRVEIRECLAQLALQDRRADVVEWCLKEDNGLRNEVDFQLEANKVKENEFPELYAILDEHCFRNTAWDQNWRRNQLALDP